MDVALNNLQGSTNQPNLGWKWLSLSDFRIASGNVPELTAVVLVYNFVF